MTPDGFRLIKQKHEAGVYNAMVLHKDDLENPIFRVDMIVEKVTPRQIFEVLRDYAQVSNWYGKNIQSKLLQITQVVLGEPAERVF